MRYHTISTEQKTAIFTLHHYLKQHNIAHDFGERLHGGYYIHYPHEEDYNLSVVVNPFSYINPKSGKYLEAYGKVLNTEHYCDTIDQVTVMTPEEAFSIIIRNHNMKKE